MAGDLSRGPVTGQQDWTLASTESPAGETEEPGKLEIAAAQELMHCWSSGTAAWQEQRIAAVLTLTGSEEQKFASLLNGDQS